MKDRGVELLPCEGFSAPCEWKGRPHPAMTAYDWNGRDESKNPNRDVILCIECHQEYVEYWKEMWAEYYSGLL